MIQITANVIPNAIQSILRNIGGTGGGAGAGVLAAAAGFDTLPFPFFGFGFSILMFVSICRTA
jgi:hypothetical protein